MHSPKESYYPGPVADADRLPERTESSIAHLSPGAQTASNSFPLNNFKHF